MKVLGIIVEYNPLHNGHLYHLEQAKKVSGADYVIAVMSGNFIQRGEPAIVDKWSRAEMALLSGVDLVLELPVVYAMSSAEFFAYGAVRILDSLGIVDYLCFGSENGKIDQLKLAAEIFYKEPETFKTLLKANLKKGVSFPSARENALLEYIKQSDTQTNLDNVAGYSNNILGIEYLKALKKCDSKIIPLTIKRKGNNYNNEHITGSVSSATSIRKFIYSEGLGKNNTIQEAVPPSTYKILKRQFELGKGPVSSDNFEKIILSKIRTMTANEIKEYPFVYEGLENRIKRAANSSGTLTQLLDEISTKRYTRTRIQRTLFKFIIGIKAIDFAQFNMHGGPQFIRVLGFNNKGRFLLSKIKSSSTLPVIAKTANFKNSSNSLFKRMMEIESLSTDIYVLAYKNEKFRKAGQEYTQNLVIINEKNE